MHLSPIGSLSKRPSRGERGCIPLIVQPQANKVGSHFLSIFPYTGHFSINFGLISSCFQSISCLIDNFVNSDCDYHFVVIDLNKQFWKIQMQFHSYQFCLFISTVVCLCCKIQSDLRRCLRSQNIKSPDTMLVMEPLALSLTIQVVFTSLSKAMNVGQLKQPSINNFLQTHKSQIIFANSSPSSMALKS